MEKQTVVDLYNGTLLILELIKGNKLLIHAAVSMCLKGAMLSKEASLLRLHTV